ncbi:MAG: hypothetical protein GY894_03945 [Planctomycetes bacterium]|jgi:hypothetical protein|nr:hypothetical protein [Planctomycetota bacterium]MCP4838501.1 hypothetical protein [Planctomycetota bacterium]
MLTAQIVALMLIVVGLSNVLWSGTWADMITGTLTSRHPAAMGLLSGGIFLLLGLAIILTKPPTDGMLIIATIVGWIMIAKGGLWLLAPPIMLRLAPRRASTAASLHVAFGLFAIIAGGVLAKAAFSGMSGHGGT